MNHQQSFALNEFAQVNEHQLGYAEAEVDEYFAELAFDFELLRKGVATGIVHSSRKIRQKSFASEKGGYSPREVDAALDRVEDRFAAFERRVFIDTYGHAQWAQYVEESAELVMGRLNREDGKRFRRPSHRLTKGYLVHDVDALCRHLRDYLALAAELSPALIRSASFESATGNLCYEETQVDAFLDRCIELILDLR